MASQTVALSSRSPIAASHGSKLRSTTSTAVFSPLPCLPSRVRCSRAWSWFIVKPSAVSNLSMLPHSQLGEVNAVLHSTSCSAQARDPSRLMTKGMRLAGVIGSRRSAPSQLERFSMKGRKRETVVIRASQYEETFPLNRAQMEEMLKLSESGEKLDSRTLMEMSTSAAAISAPTIKKEKKMAQKIEERIEKSIFNFRFLTLFGVVGSLMGAILCFLKGCLFVGHAYGEYVRACLGLTAHTSRVILYLVEAVDVYLMGTVMLIFGMGLYELFVSSLEVPGWANLPESPPVRTTVCGSNLFGLFRLRERPKWLEIRSLDELKTKLGHVIVMILLVGLFEKSKKVVIHTAVDFLCFSGSILLSAGALYLLSMLHSTGNGNGIHVKHA